MKKIRHLPQEDPVKIIAAGLRGNPQADASDFTDTYISGRQMLQLAESMRENNHRNIEIFNELVDEVHFLRWVLQRQVGAAEFAELAEEYTDKGAQVSSS